jgi:hypothetical protein
MTRAEKLLGKEKNEEFDVGKAIDSLIKTNFSASDEEKGKAAELLRGLFFADDEQSKELIKKLDDWFSSLED